MTRSTFLMIPLLIIEALLFAGFLYLCILVIKALRKYITSGEVRKDTVAARQSLAESLKQHRMDKNMTQEFVAEHLGVSRQAVSKWENGTSDPSTANLLSLAKLYGVDAAELLKGVSKENE